MSEEQSVSVYESRGLVTVERRKRGRRPLSAGESSEGICVKMPASMYDRLFAKAADSRMSIAEFVRDSIQRRI